MGAIVIGLVAGLVCFWAATALKQKLGYDDSLDVFGVHGVGGILGTLLCGVFVAKSLGGQGLADGMTIGSQVMVQLTAVIITILYCAVVTFILLKIVDAIVGLRVSQEEEIAGLDISNHEERGYNY